MISAVQRVVFDEICRRLAEGESLRAICREPEFPSVGLVLKWCDPVDGDPVLSEQYLRARKYGYLAMADEIDAIAREPVIRKKRKSKYTEVVGMDGQITSGGMTDVEEEEYDAVDARRLLIDTLKWKVSKMLPKVFGDKLQLTPGIDENGNTPSINVTFQVNGSGN